MTTPLSHDTQAVYEAVAAKLSGLHIVTYGDDYAGVGADDPPPLFFVLMDDGPTAISVTVYDVAGDRFNPSYSVQLRGRDTGSPFRVDALLDRIAIVMDWGERHPTEIWGSTRVLMSSRQSRSQAMPVDNGQAFERYDNYRITLNPGSE